MLKIYSKGNILLVICLLVLSVISSCKKDEDVTLSATQLLSYGPSPALRGGDLRFIGNNLDKVTAVILPNGLEVTTFKTKTPQLLVIEVPQATMPGRVALKTANGTIEAKSMLTISEPITIASVSPAKVRPGDVVTITGTYLNLIEEVIFANNKVVTAFESHTKERIQVRVPETAQTGPVVVSNGEEEPILVTSATALEVTLPSISGVTPNPVKAGSNLTINGTNLDLAKEIVFAGNRKVTEFTVSPDKNQITVTVPANAEDGKIKLVAASLVEVESAQAVTMVVPTISGITPSPAKNNSTITVRGTNLDLVNRVMFAGDVEGTIGSKSATELTVTVPATATDGTVTFHTAANKSVASATALTLVRPAITSVAPTTVKTLQNITIQGTNLDVVDKVVFTGGTEGTIVTRSATELVVTVPTRTQSGTFKLVTTNGTEVTSTQSLTVEAGNVPTISNIPTSVKPGEMLVIEGMKLDLATEVIFPGGLKATQFGAKTATRLEVRVPEKTEIGKGRVRFVTADGDETESPEINFVGSIAYYIYNNSLNSAWQKWNGWGTATQDMENTEHPKSGANAIKVVYNNAYGALQLHSTNANVLNGYTHLVISIYGTINNSRISIHGKTGGGAEFTEHVVTVKAGEYTTFEIPLANFKTETMSELWIKNYGENPNTIYVDEIGLR